MAPITIYIHIPYCLEKCPYCDFHSVATAKSAIPEESYKQALLAQLEGEVKRLCLKDRPLLSIYFGGGTPSLMPPIFFENVLAAVFKHFRVPSPKDSVEITVETNPATANREDFKQWLQLGINRISFGTQSFQASLLKRLGRHHTAVDSYRCVQEALAAGFENTNCDLIFGIQDQTLQELEEDLQTAAALKVPHVSAYPLTVEPNTPLRQRVEQGNYFLPAEEILVAMHEKTARMLEANGLHRYEISNYARPGFESIHNLQYWRYQEYLGVGSGAVSYVGGKRWRTTRSLKKYLGGSWDFEEVEVLDPKTAWKEKWMMGLRLKEGISLTSKEGPFEKTLSEWQAQGLLDRKEGRVWLTPKGFLVCNHLLQNIFDLVDNVC